jgi:hypothetical protein
MTVGGGFGRISSKWRRRGRHYPFKAGVAKRGGVINLPDLIAEGL